MGLWEVWIGVAERRRVQAGGAWSVEDKLCAGGWGGDGGGCWMSCQHLELGEQAYMWQRVWGLDGNSEGRQDRVAMLWAGWGAGAMGEQLGTVD